MRKSKFTNEQIAFALKQAELGIQIRVISARAMHRKERAIYEQAA
jgi:uncharacterized DUF497 family protein